MQEQSAHSPSYRAQEPSLAGWRAFALALACATVIGGVGGLIGLGGGEFRLPILVGLIGFATRSALPMNQILSLITLGTAFAIRWHNGLLVDVGAFTPAVIGLGLGGVVAAYLSARLISKISDHRLERAIALLLMAIGLLLIGERFLPSNLQPLVPAIPTLQILSGIALGLCIGTVSTFLGVAGGELLIPTLIFVFGADVHTAGSATLFISIPTICVGLWRYGRLGLLPSRRTLFRIGLPMGAESFVGAAVGSWFAGAAPADVLKLLLGVILIAAAFKAFWKRKH